MPSAKLIQRLRPTLQNPFPPEQDGILLYPNPDSVTSDDAKYMNICNRLARQHDFGERWIARPKHDNSINETRRSPVNELEWRQDCTTLYVSIDTGTDLDHPLTSIDLSALGSTDAGLLFGMLARCRGIWRKRVADLDLVHCSAEDLPLADSMFSVVFYVGGINFFSDKQKATNEMLRVAKPGIKIIIADKTTDPIQKQYKKSLLTRNYFQDTDFDLTQIENCIPETVQEKKTRLL